HTTQTASVMESPNGRVVVNCLAQDQTDLMSEFDPGSGEFHTIHQRGGIGEDRDLTVTFKNDPGFRVTPFLYGAVSTIRFHTSRVVSASLLKTAVTSGSKCFPLPRRIISHASSCGIAGL